MFKKIVPVFLALPLLVVSVPAQAHVSDVSVRSHVSSQVLLSDAPEFP